MRITAKAALPEAVTEDDDVATVRPIFVGGERSAGCRLRPEQAEEVARHLRPEKLFRIVSAGEVHEPEPVRGGIVDSADLLTPDVEPGHRAAGVRAVNRGVDKHDQPFRIRKRQRFEQHAVDDREDGGVGADPERQRRDGRDGEARRLPEHAQRVFEVPEKVGHGVLLVDMLDAPGADFG